MIPEKEREALMRLTMCARDHCAICKYKGTYTHEDCENEITKDMHILAKAVNIIHCDECKYWEGTSYKTDVGEYRKCTRCEGDVSDGLRFNTHYCAFAERRTE